jgi:hypothetical protein
MICSKEIGHSSAILLHSSPAWYGDTVCSAPDGILEQNRTLHHWCQRQHQNNFGYYGGECIFRIEELELKIVRNNNQYDELSHFVSITALLTEAMFYVPNDTS